MTRRAGIGEVSHRGKDSTQLLIVRDAAQPGCRLTTDVDEVCNSGLQVQAVHDPA